jgi:serine/threonine protein phosphatase 1
MSIWRRAPPIALGAAFKMDASLPEGERIYAIGDVHGRADLLKRVRDHIAIDLVTRPIGHATIVTLGDYVDRGPASKTVLDHLASRTFFPARLIALGGNHDLLFRDFLLRPELGEHWRSMGGVETLKSYDVPTKDFRLGKNLGKVAAIFGNVLPDAHRRFLLNLPLHFEMGDYFFCHAGVRPDRPLDQQVEPDLIWIRDEFLRSEQDFGKVVVHGHTPVEQPQVRFNRVGIDTAAYATGRLTCAVIEGDRLHFL